MDYRVGQVGRVFTIRIDHGEDILESIKTVAVREKVKMANFVLLGAIEAGNLVAGPKENVRPPNKLWFSYEDAHEIVGVGNLFWENGAPVLHLHAGLGKGASVLVGCVRKENIAFMVTEVFMYELTGFEAERVWSDAEGYSPIRFR
ncbi:PPC domain-containing DNA-binding protein [Methanolapillus millepedarum]|uniref:PPC domain-containing protein n=1 Tax=Methanolapillus millepedarum TaxID=3028296 RepID=A0AA96ZTE5_9EURY|nr:hypothetical protein MsAc7_00220 [Methanosarcinaceae archaeon Ac7]